MRKANTQVKIEFGNWKGVWSRGNPDEVPFNHLTDCLNMRFNTLSGLYTREGTSIAFNPFVSSLKVNDWILSKYIDKSSLNNISDLLLLDDTGELFLFNNGTLIDLIQLLMTNTTNPATNIIGTNFFGKTFFCAYRVINGNIYGSAGLYILDPNTNPPTIRLAAGLGPLPVMTGVMSSTTGNVPTGLRSYYCVFETNTGFLTVANARVDVTSTDDTHGIYLSSIPTGPSNIIARYLLATQAGGAVPYFIPSSGGGIIKNNTATTATVNFYDTDLVNSADYLLNLLPTVGLVSVTLFSFTGRWSTRLHTGGYDSYNGTNPLPIGGQTSDGNRYQVAAGCFQFAGRMFVWGGSSPSGLTFTTTPFNEPFNGSSVLMGSRLGDPESFDQTSCYMNVNKDDGQPIITCFQLNNILYICKKLGVFSTYDNQLEPYQWPISFVDGSISIPPKGIAYLSSSESPIAGAVIIADKSGLLAFNGSFQRPELTWKIESIWKRINQDAWNTVQVAIDTKIKSIYCAIPLDLATSPSHILMGDYSDAVDENLNFVDPLRIKWNLWKFPHNPTVIGLVDINNSVAVPDSFPVFRFASIDRILGIVQLDSSKTDDYGIPLPSYIQTAFGYSAKSRLVNMKDINTLFNLMKWNAKGSQLITATGIGYNSVRQRQLFTRNLSTASGIDLENPINFTSQKISIKLSATESYWFVDNVALFGSLTFLRTPQ